MRSRPCAKVCTTLTKRWHLGLSPITPLRDRYGQSDKQDPRDPLSRLLPMEASEGKGCRIVPDEGANLQAQEFLNEIRLCKGEVARPKDERITCAACITSFSRRCLSFQKTC